MGNLLLKFFRLLPGFVWNLIRASSASKRAVFAVLISTLAPLSGTAQTLPDNLQRFLQLFDGVAGRLAAQMTHDEVSAIWVQAPASGQPEEKFFFSRLVTVLRDSLAAPIFTEPHQNPGLEEPVDSLQALMLTYRLQHCIVVYQPLSGGDWFRSTPWQRTASVLIEIGAHEAKTRRVRFQKIWQESVSDTVAEKSLSGLENANLPFTMGRREKRQDGFNWLEAALITTATGVVVYLFYSLRSR